MKLAFFISYILLAWSISACNSNSGGEKSISNQVVENRNAGIDYSDYLKRFDGYYSRMDFEEFQIDRGKIPAAFKNIRNGNLQKIDLLYLNKVGDGFVINLGLNYETRKFQLIGTLDKNYILQDFRYFPDGSINNFSKSDTICIPIYNMRTITVELMHPNEIEEPEFEVDGIEKRVLIINDNMSLSEEN
ncbi:MAG: hypothetical protein EOP53_02670 [Sphingobacteriales bacterium]|nr:MAG: hypothetical protein EOP53_02670 [Sphingobacteriales bacterium]